MAVDFSGVTVGSLYIKMKKYGLRKETFRS